MIKNKDVTQNKGFCKKTKTRCALDPLLTKHDDECFMNAATGYCNVIKGNKDAAPPAAESVSESVSSVSDESESETSILLGDHLKLNSASTIYIVDYIDENIIFLKNVNTLVKTHLNITDGKLSPFNGEKIRNIIIIKRESDPKFTVQSKFEIGMNLSITLSLTSHPVLYCTIMDINDELDSLVVRVYKFETLVLDNTDAAYNIYIHFGCRGIPEWIHNIEIQKGVQSSAPPVDAVDAVDAIGEEYEIDLNLLEEGETFIANILYELPDIEKVVSIEKQYQSFLQNIIESIPNDKRSPTQLNAIYNSIERYIQLRTAFSSINQNGVAQILPHVEKPILNHLSDLSDMDMDAISWIVPVVSNKKKIYKKGDGSDIDIIISDHETYTIYDFFSTIRKQHEMVQSRKEYYDALRGSKIISTFFTPFDYLDSKNIVANTISHNMFTLSKENKEIKEYAVINGRIYHNYPIIDRLYVPNDECAISSFVTLDHTALFLSSLKLPSTTLYDKMFLHNMYLPCWLKQLELLHDLSDNAMDRDISAHNHQHEDFLEQYINYSYSDSSSDPIQIRDFFNTIIPSTDKLLKKIIFRHADDALSVRNVVYAAQPFFIDHASLVSDEYNQIRAFVQKNIIKYVSSLSKKATQLQNATNPNYESDGANMSKFYNLICDGAKLELQIEHDGGTISISDVFANYNLEDDKKYTMSPSEIIMRMLQSDGLSVFMNLIVHDNMNLNANLNIHSIIKREKEKLDIAIAASKNSDLDPNSDSDSSCKKRKRVLSRVYSSTRALEADNNKSSILFDLKYDSSGKRKIVNGDYAALKKLNDDQMRFTYDYFVRDNNIWVKDDDISNIELENSNLFCNIGIGDDDDDSKSCFSINQTCLNKELAETTLLHELTKKMESEYNDASQHINVNFQHAFSHNLLILKQKLMVTSIEQHKYNNIKFKIGQLFNKEESTERSPYQSIVEKILAEDDDGIKYDKIKNLVNSGNYVRECHSDESDHWFYCKKTNIPIMPVFFYTLANNYSPQPQLQFRLTLARIEKSYGVKNENGNKIVDKFSGYTIRNIDLIDEGFVLDEDRVEIESDETLLSLQSLLVQEHASALHKLGIESNFPPDDNPNPNYNLIVIVTSEFENQLGIKLSPVDSQYIFDYSFPVKESENGYTNGGAKRMSYDKYELGYNQHIIMYVIALFIFAVQTSSSSYIIPLHLQHTLTNPICTASVRGYPLRESKTDLTFITYLSCITYHALQLLNTPPWNALHFLKRQSPFEAQKLIKTQILDKIERILSNSNTTQERLAHKRTQLLQKQKQYELSYFSFRPIIYPQRREKTLPLPIPITSEFCSDLKQMLKHGNVKQTERILVIESKIIDFSTEIQFIIQNVLDTAVATSSSSSSSVAENIRKSIQPFNNVVECSSNILFDIKAVTSPSIFIDPSDSRRIVPSVEDAFNDNTIYNAFFIYCNPVNKLKYGIDTPNCEFPPGSTLEEKIDIMIKHKGIQYSANDLQALLQRVHKTSLQTLPNVHAESFVERVVPPQRGDDQVAATAAPQGHDVLFHNILDAFSTYTQNVDEAVHKKLRSTVLIEIKKFKKQMFTNISLFRQKGDASSKAVRTLLTEKKKSASSAMDASIVGSLGIMDFVVPNLAKSAQFVKNAIVNITQVYPNMISSKSSSFTSKKLPPYLNIIDQDKKDIVVAINKRRSVFDAYEDVSDFIKFVKNHSAFMIDIVLNTPITISDPLLTNDMFEAYFLYSIQLYINLYSTVPKPRKESIRQLLYSILQLVIEDKSFINNSVQSVHASFLRSLDDDREEIVHRMKMLGDDERAVKSIMNKKHNLKTTYDLEYEQSERDRIQRVKTLSLSKRGLPADEQGEEEEEEKRPSYDVFSDDAEDGSDFEDANSNFQLDDN